MTHRCSAQLEPYRGATSQNWEKTWQQDEHLSWGLELVPRKAQFDRDIHAALCVNFCSDSQLFYAMKIL